MNRQEPMPVATVSASRWPKVDDDLCFSCQVSLCVIMMPKKFWLKLIKDGATALINKSISSGAANPSVTDSWIFLIAGIDSCLWIRLYQSFSQSLNPRFSVNQDRVSDTRCRRFKTIVFLEFAIIAGFRPHPANFVTGSPAGPWSFSTGRRSRNILWLGENTRLGRERLIYLLRPSPPLSGKGPSYCNLLWTALLANLFCRRSFGAIAPKREN